VSPLTSGVVAEDVGVAGRLSAITDEHAPLIVAEQGHARIVHISSEEVGGGEGDEWAAGSDRCQPAGAVPAADDVDVSGRRMAVLDAGVEIDVAGGQERQGVRLVIVEGPVHEHVTVGRADDDVPTSQIRRHHRAEVGVQQRGGSGHDVGSVVIQRAGEEGDVGIGWGVIGAAVLDEPGTPAVDQRGLPTDVNINVAGASAVGRVGRGAVADLGVREWIDTPLQGEGCCVDNLQIPAVVATGTMSTVAKLGVHCIAAAALECDVVGGGDRVVPAVVTFGKISTVAEQGHPGVQDIRCQKRIEIGCGSVPAGDDVGISRTADSPAFCTLA